MTTCPLCGDSFDDERELTQHLDTTIDVYCDYYRFNLNHDNGCDCGRPGCKEPRR